MIIRDFWLNSAWLWWSTATKRSKSGHIRVLHQDLHIQNTLFQSGWMDHKQMDARRLWELHRWWCWMKVVVLVRGRDVPQEQRSHLWRLKQEEIKNNNLMMAVIEFLLCSSSRSCIISGVLGGLGGMWCSGYIVMTCICVHWQPLNLLHSSVWWDAGPAEEWHSSANESHAAVKEWKNAGIYRKRGRVRLREERLVNRALAGWLIRCSAGTPSPCLFFFP